MLEVISTIMALSIPLVALSIPIVAIISNHRRKLAMIKQKHLQEEIELERLKNENFLLETEKLKLELEKMKAIDYIPEETKLLK